MTHLKSILCEDTSAEQFEPQVGLGGQHWWLRHIGCSAW